MAVAGAACHPRLPRPTGSSKVELAERKLSCEVVLRWAGLTHFATFAGAAVVASAADAAVGIRKVFQESHFVQRVSDSTAMK